MHSYAAVVRNFWTLEDTLVGFMFNDLIWCGQDEDIGENHFPQREHDITFSITLFVLQNPTNGGWCYTKSEPGWLFHFLR